MSPLRFELPPGPHFIFRHLLTMDVVSFCTFFYCARLGALSLAIDFPQWAIIVSLVAALPMAIYVQSEFQYWRDMGKAESLGARLAPKVPCRWPAGIDLITTVVKAFKSGYPGDVIDDWLIEGGQTMDMRSLWTSHVCCSCRPNSSDCSPRS